MKIEPLEISTEQKNEFAFEDTSFCIGDLSIILSVLRHKMYSNPIKIIAQEIMCNARDAHREVGKEDVPISITLPTDNHPYLHIRDFGPGISPKRMKNIFVAYGNSTKTSNDDQTGGFGLGGKTPLAYSDSFDIVTITPEMDMMVRRHYRAYIDESRIGNMALKDSTVTDEPQGTDIIIPIESYDFPKFFEAVREAASWWDTKYVEGVKPEITNFNNEGSKEFWRNWEDETVRDGVNWCLLDRGNMFGTSLNPIAVVDGISYPITLAQLKLENTSPGWTSYLVNIPFRLFFTTGEVQQSANREALDYNKATVDIVSFRLQNAITQLKDDLQKELDATTNLWDATCIYKDIVAACSGSANKMILSNKWQGIELHVGGINLSTSNCHLKASFYKLLDVPSYCQGYSKLFDKHKAYTIDAKADTVLCVNDLDSQKASAKVAWSVLQMPQYSKKNRVCIINKNDAAFSIKGYMAELNRFAHIDKMAPVYLSSLKLIPLPKRVNAPSGGSGRGSMGNAVVFSVHTNPQTNAINFLTSSASIDFSNGSGYYVIKHYGSNHLDDKEGAPCVYELVELVNDCGLKDVYAVTRSQAPRLGNGWIPLKTLIEKKVKEYVADSQVEFWESEMICFLKKAFLDVRFTEKMLQSFNDELPDGHLIRRFIDRQLECKTENRLKTYRTVSRMKDVIYVPLTKRVSTLSSMTDEIKRKYPLVAGLTARIVMADYPKIVEKFIAYVKGVDAGKLGD